MMFPWDYLWLKNGRKTKEIYVFQWEITHYVVSVVKNCALFIVFELPQNSWIIGNWNAHVSFSLSYIEISRSQLKTHFCSSSQCSFNNTKPRLDFSFETVVKMWSFHNERGKNDMCVQVCGQKSTSGVIPQKPPTLLYGAEFLLETEVH